MFGGFSGGGGGGFGGQQQQQNTGFGAAPGGFGSTSSFGAPTTGFGAAAQPTGFGGAPSTGGFGAAPTTGGFGAAPASTGFGGGGFGGSSSGFGVQAQQQTQPQTGFGGSSFGGAGQTASAGGFGGFGGNSAGGGFGSAGGFGAKPATTGFGAAPTGFGAAANTGFGGGAATSSFGGGMNAPAGQGTANPPFAPFVEKDPSTGQNSHYQSITAMPAYRNYSFDELRLQDYQQGRKAGQAAGGMGAGGGFGAATSGFGAQPATTGFGAQPSTGGFGATNTPSTLGGGFGAGSTGFGGASTGGGFGTTGGFGSTPASTGFGAQPAQSTGFGGQSTAFGAPSSGFGAAPTTGFGAQGGFGAAAASKPATGFGAFGAPATSTAAPAFGAAGGFGGATTTPSLFGGAPGTTGGFGTTPASTATSGFGGFGTTPASAAPASTGLGFGLGGSNAFGAAKPATGLFGAAPAASAAAPAFGFGATPAASTGGGLFGGAATGSSLFPATSAPASGAGLFGGAGASAAPAFGATPTSSLFGPKPATTGGLFSTPSSAFGGPSAFGIGAQQPSPFGVASTTPFSGTSTHVGGFLGGSTATAQTQPSLVASVNSNIYGENPLFLRDSAAPATKTQPAVLSRADPAQKLPALIPSVRFSPRHSHIRLRPSSTATFASSVNGTSDTGAGRRSLLLLDGINDDTSFSADEYTPRRSVKKLDLKPRGQEPAQNAGQVDHSRKAGVSFNPALETAAESLVRRNGSDRPALTFGNGHGASSQAQSSQAFTTHENFTTRQENNSYANQPSAIRASKNDSEYWMSPPLEELQKMTSAELQRVENFKVGRPGYGSVDFQQPVDLTGLPSLSSICGTIVVFEHKVCRVYPDATIKAPRGQGLNVPAIISLENCWPVDKTTQKPLKFDSHSPMYQKHVKRLRRQPETTFIDFTVEEGTWTFRVEHFSEYGLGDDSDDDEEAAAVSTSTVPARASSAANIRRTATATRSTLGASSNEPDKRMKGKERSVPSNVIDMDMDTESGPGIFQRPYAGANQDPQRRYMMQMSLFPDESSSEQKRNVKRSNGWSGSPEFSEHTDGLGAEHETTEKRAPLLSRPPRKFFRSAYEESIMSRKGNLLADAGLMMGRSCRVGWGPGGMMAVCGTLCDFESVKESSSTIHKPETVSASTVKYFKVKMVADAMDTEVARHQVSLQAQLEHSKIVLDERRLPRANVTAGTSFSDMLRSLKARKQHLLFEEINAWKLGQTLFDSLPQAQIIATDMGAEDDSKELVEVRARTIACSEWLSDVSEGVTKAELEQFARSGTRAALEGSIVTFLVSNNRERASVVAVQAKNPRLATLIAQTGRGSKSLPKIEDQLLVYKNQSSDNIKIPDFYMKALALLSGALTTDIAPKGQPSRYVTDGLDWRRTLGLHLWYSNTAEVDLATALDEYVDSLAKSSKIAKPLPLYRRQGANSEQSSQKQVISGGSEHYDFMFQLIGLLVHPSMQLETVLHPLGISPSRLDYRQSWQFYMILSQSLEVASFGSPTSHAHICSNFMSQLENLGMWTWAIFVALHLETSEAREMAVRALLERNMEVPRPASSTGHSSSSELDRVSRLDGANNNTSFLLKDLLIPEEWLWTARATQARYHGDVSLQVFSLLKSGEHSKAHAVILSELAPRYVLYGGLEILGKLLGMVDQSKVPGWQSGGGVYQKYLECISDSEGNVGEVVNKGLSSSFSSSLGRVSYANQLVYPDDLEAFQAAIQDLIPKLSQLLKQGPKGLGGRTDQMLEICVVEMTSKCTNLLRDLAAQENVSSDYAMGEDQCVSSIQKISTDYFDEILASAETAAY
ncbi:hypothetical protein BG004_006376 [Podila humilis]|nr:hypothetical protein BG004_006376 [Podila humilis]